MQVAPDPDGPLLQRDWEECLLKHIIIKINTDIIIIIPCLTVFIIYLDMFLILNWQRLRNVSLCPAIKKTTNFTLNINNNNKILRHTFCDALFLVKMSVPQRVANRMYMQGLDLHSSSLSSS